jgi:6-phosphogluconolactonase
VVEVFPNKEALAQAAAELFVTRFSEGIAESGRFSVVLSGGTTPRHIYECLAEDPFRSRVDWRRVNIFWGDERCVPLSDIRSNFKMAKEALLSKIDVPGDQIHPIQCASDSDKSAMAYESVLTNYFRKSSPYFDLTFIGLGKDGHTASLFPESPALNEKERWVAVVRKESEDFERITMTLPLLNRTRVAVFLVEGEEKADILKKVLSASDTSSSIPARLIQPVDGRLIWLVDRSAWSQVPTTKLS